VVGAFGTRGALRVVSFSEKLSNYKKLYSKDSSEFLFKVVKFIGKTKLVISLENITDRNSAELLKNKEFYVKKSDLPKIEKNEFYLCDLVGKKLQVLGTNIECKVTNVHNFGAGDLLEISHENDVFLAPFTKENFPDSSNEILMTSKAFEWFKN
jgi:16S rRNA processing protein RimM